MSLLLFASPPTHLLAFVICSSVVVVNLTARLILSVLPPLRALIARTSLSSLSSSASPVDSLLDLSPSPSLVLRSSLYSSTSSYKSLARPPCPLVDFMEPDPREGPVRILKQGSWVRLNQVQACAACRKRRVRCSSFYSGAPCESCARRSSPVAPSSRAYRLGSHRYSTLYHLLLGNRQVLTRRYAHRSLPSDPPTSPSSLLNAVDGRGRASTSRTRRARGDGTTSDFGSETCGVDLEVGGREGCGEGAVHID